MQKSLIAWVSFNSLFNKQICEFALIAILGATLINPSGSSAATCDSLSGTISSNCTNYVTGQTNLDIAIPSGVTVTTGGSTTAVSINQFISKRLYLVIGMSFIVSVVRFHPVNQEFE